LSRTFFIFGTYSVNAQVINEQEACQRAEAFIETHGLSTTISPITETNKEIFVRNGKKVIMK
jgi:hypothetical protein